MNPESGFWPTCYDNDTYAWMIESQDISECDQEFELEGLTMGIVGFGGTGRAIAKRAHAFGMKCIAVDRDPVEASLEISDVWNLDKLDDLLAESDVIACGLPLTPETQNFFNAEVFEKMKTNAILINVTRGECVDGDALVFAIDNKQIYAAGLDVAPQEPLSPHHSLWKTSPDISKRRAGHT